MKNCHVKKEEKNIADLPYFALKHLPLCVRTRSQTVVPVERDRSLGRSLLCNNQSVKQVLDNEKKCQILRKSFPEQQPKCQKSRKQSVRHCEKKFQALRKSVNFTL